MRITIDLLSPLSHGTFSDVSAGNASMLRREPIVSLPGMPCVPVLSGNSLRNGACRRLVMRHLFDHLGLSRGSFEAAGHPARWDRLYAALANGGHLDSSENRVIPSYIRDMRSALPALSVFGAALYSFMLPGRMRVGFAWLVCDETAQAGLVSADGPTMPAETMVHETSLVRHIDRAEQDPEVSGVTPMPTTIEVIGAGARLESYVSFERGTSEIEQSVLPWALDQVEYLGAKSASGLGHVRISHDGDSKPYADWLESNRDAAQMAMLDLSVKLTK